MKKYRIISGVLAIFICVLMILPWSVHAAAGKMSISVDKSDIEVGEVVVVTIWGTDEYGDKVISDMELTYDTSIFEFAGCGVDFYTGGSGGTVKVRANAVTVRLKAIAPGETNVKLTGSNGELASNGTSMSGMSSAGATVRVTGTAIVKSNNNQLSSLEIGSGTLNPQFSPEITEYTAAVTNEVTSLQLSMLTAHDKAVVESVTGTDELIEGENTIVITVAAEDGSKREYRIIVTREVLPEVQEPQAPNEDEPVDEPVDNATEELISRYEAQIAQVNKEKQQLEAQKQREIATYKTTIIVLSFVTVVLAVVLINVIVFSKRSKDDPDDWDDIDAWKEHDKDPLFANPRGKQVIQIPKEGENGESYYDDEPMEKEKSWLDDDDEIEFYDLD